MMDIVVLAGAACAIFGVVLLAVVGLFLLNRSGDDAPSKSRKSRGKGASRPAGTAARSNQKFNWLIGRSGSVEGKTFHVGQRLATIGRGVGNFIQINDENSSRVHAQFQGAASGMQIKDMGSSNGTLVNGERVSEASFHPLHDGDEIQIGDTLLAYRKVGNFRDEALTGTKNVRASQQEKTQALGAVAGGGDLQEQIRNAAKESGGDYGKVAEQFGLDVEVIETIVDAEK